MLDLYRAIWRRTGREQILLILLSIIGAVLAAVPIDYQKRIINGMAGEFLFADLLRLGGEMLFFILLSLALKGYLSYRTGIVAEKVILYLRESRIDRAVARGKSDDAKPETGTLSNIISSESETLGKFVGGAFAEPLLQVGTLVSVVGYVAFNSLSLSLIITAIILPQAVLVLITQGHINRLVKTRVKRLREAINRITQGELAKIALVLKEDFIALYHARRRMFIWKLSTKFVLNLFNGVGLVFVLVYGGWRVTLDETDMGTVVAATVALTRIQQPWRQLIAFYRSLSVAQVQYELIRDAAPRTSQSLPEQAHRGT